MLYEFGELAKLLPKRRKYLHWYIVGITDGEGCFNISIKKQKDTRWGYVIDPVFHVVQGEKGLPVLKAMKVVFNAGRIEKKHGQDEWQFIVDNRKQLAEKVVPFFKKYPLIIKKDDFEIFSQVVEELEKKEHWTKEGFIKLLKLSYKLTRQKRKRSLEEILNSLKGGSPQRPYARAPPKKPEQGKEEA